MAVIIVRPPRLCVLKLGCLLIFQGCRCITKAEEPGIITNLSANGNSWQALKAAVRNLTPRRMGKRL